MSARDHLRSVPDESPSGPEDASHVTAMQLLFRQVNEQVQRLDAARPRGKGEKIRVLCECGTQSCLEQIDITLAEYQRIRSEPELFVIKPGHDAVGVDEVAFARGTYWAIRVRRERHLRPVPSPQSS